MASGQKHDKATIILSIPFSLCIALISGIESAMIAGSSFCITGLWLSPDLDINSRCLNRWGILKILWKPYSKLITHRSFLSHGVFIGTALRITYLITIVMILNLLVNLLGINLELLSLYQIKNLIEKYPHEVIAILLGAEGSAWLHLILDGDPFPKFKQNSNTN